MDGDTVTAENLGDLGDSELRLILSERDKSTCGAHGLHTQWPKPCGVR